MLSARTGISYALALSLGVCGCSEVLGAADLDYTLGGEQAEAGVVAPGSNLVASCAGTAGPTPVNVEGKFCIDSTEVTNAQYLAFMEAAPAIEQPAECAWNAVVGESAFEPRDVWPPPEPLLNHPVSHVDWCDARAYCQWAGKRLCGRVDRSPPDWADHGTVRAELYYACSHGGEQVYPYGDVLDPNACAIDRSETQPVMSFPACEGGYAGVYDLVGNVMEWQAFCMLGSGATDYCRLGPRSAQSGDELVDSVRCDFGDATARNGFSGAIGVRCCSDAL
jgi:formylglycine-generating enzyme